MGLFGLGAPEIVVILVAVAFVVGPQQIGRMAGDLAGKAKGELNELPEDLKRIPEEFMKGVDEGETNSRARNAKPMKDEAKEKEGSKKEDE
jgi:Sec-independent protein translocase protein TatA